MTDLARVLTSRGTERFRAWLTRGAAAGEPTPRALLIDPECSAPLAQMIEIEAAPGGKPFTNRYDFGVYLRNRLAPLNPVAIARDTGLWNWLSLYYFDHLCPSASEGTRGLLATEVYVLSPERKYRQVFRHLVRGPWYAACEHGENAKVLLIHTERSGVVLATRGRIFEDLASRQSILGNRTVIAAAQRLYFDNKYNRPRFGASGYGPGSVRRFAIVVQQLELTYDTRACSVDQLLSLLPREFNEWMAKLQ
jgi:hypothetical protein